MAGKPWRAVLKNQPLWSATEFSLLTGVVLDSAGELVLEN
jgi:hypothetical protein